MTYAEQAFDGLTWVTDRTEPHSFAAGTDSLVIELDRSTASTNGYARVEGQGRTV